MVRELAIGSHKGREERVRVTVTREGVEVRIASASLRASECKPTTAGLTLSPEHWRGIMPMLDEAVDEAQEQG